MLVNSFVSCDINAVHTWSRRETGKHALKVALESMLFMNDWQLVVILLLKPVSKGEGRGLAAAVPSARTLLEVVVDASVGEDAAVFSVLDADGKEELAALRFLRSSLEI